MAAFTHTSACFLLWATLLISCAVAAPAPVAEGDVAHSQALDYHSEAGTSRCYYNFQHYEEGDRIVTNEPCLNCTCHKRMLMCYLRVCPFTKAIGQDCTIEKKPDQCCPVITCPEVPVDILTSSTTTQATTSTAVGHVSNYGCTLEDNTFYPDGVQMPSDPKKPCELCYCIRNHTACVRQECTLNVEGCRPVYQDGVCCPVRYDCDSNEIGTTERPSTGGLILGTTPNPLQCHYGETKYNDGELIQTEKPCESCYCMRGDIVCAVRSCGEPMDGKDCQALPPPEGKCCPTTYQCANGTIAIEPLATESSIIMQPADVQTKEPENEPKPPSEAAEDPIRGPTSDVKKEEPVPQTEASPSDVGKEQEEGPDKNVDNKIEEQSGVAEEHVQSDPIDSDELEEEALYNPTPNAGLESTNLVTDSSTDLSEHLSTSAPDSVSVQQTDSHPVGASEGGSTAEESASGAAGPIAIESDETEVKHTSTESHITSNVLTEDESKPAVDSEGSTAQENQVIDSDETIPKIPESATVVSQELEETSHKHVEADHIKDEQEPHSAPADTETTTEAVSQSLWEGPTHKTPISTSDSEEAAAAENEVKKDATKSEEENQGVPLPTDDASKEPDIGSNKPELKPNEVGGTTSSEPEKGIENVEDTKTESPDSVPAALDNTETKPDKTQDEPEKSEPIDEGTKHDKPISEAESKPQEEGESSLPNKNEVVLQENVPKIPESPEALDQVKESDASIKKETAGATESPVVHTEDGTEVPASDYKPESIHAQGEMESKPEESESSVPTKEKVEASEAPTKPSLPQESESGPKEPVPPRKEDAAPEEPILRPQHPEGSMTKADDSIPTHPTQTVSSEIEMPVKTKEPGTNQETEISDELEAKPTIEISESGTSHDDSEESSPETTQQADDDHEGSNIQTEHPSASETPVDHSVSLQETPKTPSEDEGILKPETPQTSNTKDQAVLPESDATNDDIKNESTTDKTKPEDTQKGEAELISTSEEEKPDKGESVPSIVTQYETEIATDGAPEASSKDKVTPEKPLESAKDESESVSTQTEKVEETTINEAAETPTDHAHPSSEETSYDEKLSTKPTKETIEEESSGNVEESEKPETINNISNDDTTASGDDESSTKDNAITAEDVAPTKDQSEVGEVPEKAVEEPTPSKEEASNPPEQSTHSAETNSMTEKDTPDSDHPETTYTGIKPTVKSPEHPDTESGDREEPVKEEPHTESSVSEEPLKEESHTESSVSEESSTHILIKTGESESKPEGTESETGVEESSTESKPVESSQSPIPSISSELEKKPDAESTDTNEFEEVAHDPIESDPTDFEDQQYEETDHFTHESPSENEIVDDHHLGHGGSIEHKPPVAMPGPVGVIPGEGDCLINGKTYTNNSRIPSKSPCHKECTCLSSIVHCQGIDCPPPPPHMANCMPVHQGDMCCPVYTCDGDMPEGLQSHSHMGETEHNHGEAGEQPPTSSSGESSPESSGHFSSGGQTDLPSKPKEENRPLDETAEQTSADGETHPEGDAQPAAPEESETQSNADGISPELNPSGEEIEASTKVSKPSSVEEIPQSEKEENTNSDISPPVESEIEQEEQSSDNIKPSHESGDSTLETGNEKDTSETAVEPHQPLEEEVTAEEQPTPSAEEEISSVKPDSDASVPLVHSEEGIESDPTVTEHNDMHEAKPEESLSTDVPIIQENLPEVPTIPEENNARPESESPTNTLKEDGESQQNQADIVEETQSPAVHETHEIGVTLETTPDTSSAVDDTHEGGTNAPAVENAGNDSSSGIEKETSSGENNDASKHEAQPTIGEAESTPEQTTSPNVNKEQVSTEKFDKPFQSSEEPANIPFGSDIKPTVSSEAMQEVVQPTIGESLTSDDGSSLNEHVEHGEEIKHDDVATHGPGESVEHLSTEKPVEGEINSETEHTNTDSDTASLPESSAPIDHHVEDIEPPTPNAASEIPSTDDSSNDEIATHSVQESTEISHSEVPSNPNIQSSDEVSHEGTFENDDKETLSVTNSGEEVQNEVTVTEAPESSQPPVSEEQKPAVSESQGAHGTDILETETKPGYANEGTEPGTVQEHQSGDTKKGDAVDDSGIPVTNILDGGPAQPSQDIPETLHDTEKESETNSQEPTESLIESEQGPSTDKPVVEVDDSIKEHIEESKQPSDTGDDSISTEGYSENVKSPESDDLTISEGHKNVPAIEHQEPTNDHVMGSPEIVSATPDTNEVEASKPIPEAPESEEHSPKPITPEQTDKEAEQNRPEFEHTSDHPQPTYDIKHPAHDSEPSVQEPVKPGYESEQPIHEPEHPVHDTKTPEHTPEEPEHGVIEALSKPIKPNLDAGESVHEGGEAVHEEESHGEGTPHVEEEPVHEDGETNHEEKEPVHEELVPAPEGEKPLEEEQVHGEEDSVHTEVPVHGEGETANEEVLPEGEPVHEDGETINNAEQPNYESEPPVHEPEHTSQESDQSIHEPEQPVQEPEQTIQETGETSQQTQDPGAPGSSEGPQISGDEESKPELEKPSDSEIPTEDQFPSGADMDYDLSEDGAFGPGTCRYGGKVYVSAQQIPRDDPCDFCFCFRSDIICLQQSCPPPIHRCHQEPIQGYCCPRYQCPVSMATSLNLTTTTTTTTTTLPPHFFAHAYHGAARQAGCLHRGRAYSVGEEISTASGPCLQCICGSDGQMKCDPVVCSPEPMLRKMMEAAVSHRRR